MQSKVTLFPMVKVLFFYQADSWSFGNDFAKNVVFFGVDNSSTSHIDNRKNNCKIVKYKFF